MTNVIIPKNSNPIASKEYVDRNEDCYTFFDLDKEEFEFKLLSLVLTGANRAIYLKTIYKRYIAEGISPQQRDSKQKRIRDAFYRVANKNVGLMIGDENGSSKICFYWESQISKSKYLNSNGKMSDSFAHVFNLVRKKLRDDIPNEYFEELEPYFKQAKSRSRYFNAA